MQSVTVMTLPNFQLSSSDILNGRPRGIPPHFPLPAFSSKNRSHQRPIYTVVCSGMNTGGAENAEGCKLFVRPRSQITSFDMNAAQGAVIPNNWEVICERPLSSCSLLLAFTNEN